MKTSKSEPNPLAPTNEVLDYWHIFRQLPESYLLLAANDPTYTIVELNKTREKLTNVQRAQAIGRPLFEVYPDTSETYKTTGVNRVHEQLKRVLRTKRAVQLPIIRYDLKNKQQVLEERYWQSTYMPVCDKAGQITHILAATQDVTTEYATEKRMVHAEERLDAALAIGKVGSWVWDIKKDIVVADSNLAHMFGISRAAGAKGLALRSFLDVIHDEDRTRVEQAIRSSLQHRTAFDEEYRTFAVNGKMRWVLARGRVEKRDQQQLFTGVIVDITERRDLQAQVELARRQDRLNREEAKILQQRNQELETISRTKDEFVALASHQLRTPATAVKQYLGMVLQGYAGTISELQTDMLEKAFESNERQINIINQILNAARVDTGRLVMAPVPIDFTALARGITDEMRADIEGRGHSFQVAVPKVPLPVMADLSYLRMAIENLLHNAAIYTPAGGSITLRLEKLGSKRALLSVTDTGVGIKKVDQTRLFEKFSRIHNPLSVQAGGSGIGLYLASEIVRLHGGEVSVESKIHKGTTFAISLPLNHNKPQAEQGN